MPTGPTGQLVEALGRLLANQANGALLEKALWSLLLIALLAGCYQLARWAWLRRIQDMTARHRARKRLRVGLSVVGITLGLLIWAPFSGWLLTWLTIVAAALTIVLKEVILNLAGGVYIALSRPFELGDRIEIAGIRGDVVDIRPTRFTVLELGNWVEGEQSTGRLVHIPNGQLFTHPVHNATEGLEYLWHELTIICPFESDWQQARRLLEAIACEVSAPAVRAARTELERLSERYPIRMQKLEPFVYTEITPQGVKLTLRYLSPVRARRVTADEIQRRLLQALPEHPGVRLLGMAEPQGSMQTAR
ncbi:MAG: mechanosensitive ion channel family protein [Bacteroidetes bacterium]|nr:mechanosensitive ion channel family protein [Rhodothermia bacterium]MCS7155131.1 mechanosensitive ion channel family protein [Bacteroidota bacterium]MCX7907360.1 mechanosensitive ion channel family protein [Bacteroidota bacterium]MDW8137913.1 mechanosensitive ion channel [Bacteroidota bacterium]MDW8286236.1 mechanosensitive ion channel [Bacteroidota bacterium]